MKKFLKVLRFLILAVLLYTPIFSFIESQPIRLWDESRLAINATEMSENGNYLIPTFEGSPDYWNTKPPFLIWCQVFFIKLLGVNELSIRLPSSISGLLLCVSLILFSIKYYKNFWFGLIVVLILITSSGYVGFHALRTGDYDALLTFFSCLSGLFFFSFIETEKFKFFYLSVVFVALAVLTKSTAGLLFIPAYLMYALFRNRFLVIIKSRHFYIGIILFLILVGSYYFGREWINPGYLKSVYYNDIGGRYLNTLEGHNGDIWFYFDKLIDSRFSYWFLLFPVSLVIGVNVKDNKMKNLTNFSVFMCFTYFIIISTAKTKLEWYDVPLYPFLSIISANLIFIVFNILKSQTYFKDFFNFNVLPYCFLFLVFITPYRLILTKTYRAPEELYDKELYSIGYYLKDAVNNKVDLNNCFIIYDFYYAQNLFYVNILRNKGVKVQLKNVKNVNVNEDVISYSPSLEEFLKNKFEMQLITDINGVKRYKILAQK